MSPTATDVSGARVDLGFAAFDADNHYYEAEDAFIRHIPRDMAKRCMQWRSSMDASVCWSAVG